MLIVMRKSITRPALALLVVAIAALILWVMYFRNAADHTANTPQVVVSDIHRAIAKPSVSPTPSVLQRRTPALQSQGLAMPVLDAESNFTARKCDVSEAECEMDPLVAKTSEEAQWLLQHGYPTHEQLQGYEALTTDALREKAITGDLLYRAFYGRRLIEEGDYMPGVANLIAAAREGGIYALYEMSAAHGKDDEHFSRVDNLAYLRLAYLMGDARAAVRLAQVASDRGYGIAELMYPDQHAAHLRKQMLGETNVPPRP